MGPLRLNEWKDRAVVIIGGGPSLDLKQIRRIGMSHAVGAVRVIAVNDAVYPAWFADVAYACDAKWWRWHGGVPGYGGHRYALEQTPFAAVTPLENTGTTGFDPLPFRIRSGGNSGYQAMCLATHLGVSRIILVGFDNRAGQEHWFGLHPEEIRMRAPVMSTRNLAFDELSKILKVRGIDVVNATPGSELASFRRGTLAEILSEVESQHDQIREGHTEDAPGATDRPADDREGRPAQGEAIEA